jgi:hypothetical protein
MKTLPDISGTYSDPLTPLDHAIDMTRKYLAGPGQPCVDALADHLPLKFSEHAEHAEERLTCRRGGVDALLVEVQIDPYAVQFLKESDEVEQRPPQAIY